MNLPVEIENKLDKLFELCIKYKVVKLFIFGSSSKGNFNNKTSDVDLIVDIENLPPVEKGENLMNFWTQLDELFDRKVDLLTNKNINNPYLKEEIDNSKLLLYDKAS